MPNETFSISAAVLFPDDSIKEATVFLEGGRIGRITPGRDSGADIAVNGTLIPGLIDLQVNGAYGHDFTLDATTITPVAERLPETGVTSFLPTIITSRFSGYPARLRELAEAMRVHSGAHVLGAHLEGPYINPIRKGAHPVSCIRPIDVAEIRAWANPALTRIVTLAPELPNGLEAIRVLREAGILVSVGHSNATFAEAQAAFAAGAAWGTHLYSAMSPLLHREPGLMGALLDSPVPCGLIVDGFHNHPAMVRLAWKAKGPHAISLVTDCMAAMGMGPGQYMLGEYLVTVDENVARLDENTLAGSILTMDQAVHNVMSFTGCSLAEAVRAASTTPANLLRLERKGRIASGCDADLVLLSPQNEVTHTFVAGGLVYARA